MQFSNKFAQLFLMARIIGLRQHPIWPIGQLQLPQNPPKTHLTSHILRKKAMEKHVVRVAKTPINQLQIDFVYAFEANFQFGKSEK